MSAVATFTHWSSRKVILGFLVAVLLVCGFDLLHTLLFPVDWPLLSITLLAAVPVLMAALVTILLSRKHPAGRFVGATRRWTIALGLTLVTPIMVALVHSVSLMPMKFLYLTHRMESAATAEAERNAFRLASRWGHVWEVEYVDHQYLPSRYQGGQAERLLKVEWLESWPSGAPFQAYRQVIDDRNLREFERKGTSQADGPANGSQPIRSETNSTSSAAGLRR